MADDDSAGPQAERHAQWASEVAVQPPVDREIPVGVDLQQVQDAHDHEATALKRQNNYLRDLVARHEAVIAQYQRQLPNFRPASPEAGPSGEGGAAASRDEGEGAHPGSALPPWILDAEQTTPLLSAYDVRIRELESSLRSSTEDLGRMRGHVEELTQENEGLRADSQHYVDKLVDVERGEMTTGARTGGSVAQAEELQEAQEQLEVVMKENGVLAQQVATLEAALEEARERASRGETAAEEAVASARDVAGRLESAHKELDEVAAEKDSAEGRVRDLASRVVTLEDEKGELEDELAQARRTASQYKDSTSEHLATVDDLRRRATQEQETLLARVKQETQRARSLRQRLAARESEWEQATAQLRAARAELVSTRSDAEGMVKVIASLERQVGEHRAREESVQSLAQESKEKVEEVLLERDNAQAKEVAARAEIARLLQGQREQAKAAAARTQQEIDATTAPLKEQLQQRDEEIDDLSRTCATLRQDAEERRRALASAREAHDALRKAVEEQREDTRQRLQEATSRATGALQRADAAEESLREAQEAAAKAEEEAARRVDQLHSDNGQLSASLASAEKEVAALQRQRDEVTAALRRADEELTQLRRDIGEARESADTAVAEAQERARGEVAAAEQRAEAAERGARTLRDQLREAREERDATVRAKKGEMQRSVAHFERVLGEHRTEVQRLEARNQELEARVAALLRERQDVHEVQSAAADMQGRLQAVTQDAEWRASQASAQAAALVAQEERRVNEERQLRMSLERASAEKARALRAAEAAERKRRAAETQARQFERALVEAGVPMPPTLSVSATGARLGSKGPGAVAASTAGATVRREASGREEREEKEERLPLGAAAE